MRSSSEIACSEIGLRRHLGDALLVGVDRRRRRRAARPGIPARSSRTASRTSASDKRQHLAAQRLVQRRQPVELQQADDPAQGQPVDQQREQHEAGRQHRDEILDRRVDVSCSVTDSASARVTAPRSPPQVIASL